MPTTRARNVRRAAQKRTILSALDENNPSNDLDMQVPTSDINMNMMMKHHHHQQQQNHDHYQHQKPFHIPKDLDLTTTTTSAAKNGEHAIDILLQDIEQEVKRRQENIVIKCCEATSHQLSILTLNMMKIESRIKNMTIREFNSKYMNNNGTAAAATKDGGEEKGAEGNDGDFERNEKTDIVALMKSLMRDERNALPSSSSSSSSLATDSSMLGKKRIRDRVPPPMTMAAKNQHPMDLETPVRPHRHNMRTPGTILRTAKRGEMLMSANGSPVEQCEDGALIATVTKKRRAGHGLSSDHDAGAMFDINVGGKVISLSDPKAMSHLSHEMKSTVTAQLNVLQDQISKLMTQIES